MYQQSTEEESGGVVPWTRVGKLKTEEIFRTQGVCTYFFPHLRPAIVVVVFDW